MRTFLNSARERPFAAIVFVGALLATLWYAGNFTAQVIYWNDPAHRNQALEPWMSMRYVQHSYALDPESVGRILKLEVPFRPGLKVSELEILSQKSLDQLTQELRAQAAIEKAARQARGDE